MKCFVNSSPRRIDFCCYAFAVFLLPLASAVISSDRKALASNLDRKTDTIEGSGSNPEKTSPSKTDSQIRPDTEFNSSGASPDDEDGDVNEGSGEIEGSGAAPSNVVVVSTTKSTVLSSTSRSTTTTLSTTITKPRHQFNEERIVNMQGGSGLKHETPTTRQPILLDQRTTSISTPTTRQTPWTVILTTRPPPNPTTPAYGSDSGEFEMLKPGILAAVSGGAVVGILMTILLVMFIIYRMRKKDEGSYSLDEPHAPPNYSYAYQKASTKEFYA